MLWDNYNPEDFSENEYTLIPEGRYRVRIEDAEEATSHSGKNMIKLTLAVSGYRSKLWSYIVLDATTPEQIKATNRKLGAIFNSFDIVEGNMHISDWRGCVGGAQVVHKKDATGKDRAEIAYFLYRKNVNELPDWQEAGMPTQGNVDPDMVDFGDTSSQPSGVSFPF